MKVLVATEKPFAKIAVDGIRKEIEAAGYELVLLEKYTDKAQLLDAVKDANAIIIRSDIIDAEVLDAAKELKIVVRAGAGYDNVDLASATAHDVCVMNTPGQNSNAVAELALGMMVYAVRNFYNGTSGTDLPVCFSAHPGNCRNKELYQLCFAERHAERRYASEYCP